MIEPLPRRRGAFRAGVILLSVTMVLGSTASAGSAAAVDGSANLSGSAVAALGTARSAVELTDGWRFLREDAAGAAAVGYNDAAWAAVSVPHTWNVEDAYDEVIGYYRGVGWYRRHIAVPASLAGKALFLEFDGASIAADVYLNGTWAARHEGGHSRFRVPVASVPAGGDLVVAVRVDNSANDQIAPLSDDWIQSGGLHQGVRLVAVDRVHIDLLDDGGPGVYLRTRNVSASTIVTVQTRVRSDATSSRKVTAATVILDKAGQPVAVGLSNPVTVAPGQLVTVQQDLTVRSPHLWQGLADPYLYQVQVRLIDAGNARILDNLNQPLGIRTVAVDAQRGFLLNGQQYRLYGVNMHQGREQHGSAETKADIDQDLDTIKEMGARSVRLVHYQHAPYVYERADSDGLVLWTEIPFMHRSSDSPAFAANVRMQLRELVKQNYNHPSVAFWSIGNEPTFKEGPDPNPLLVQLAADLKVLDPNRIDAYATCCVADDDVSLSHTTAVGYHRYEGWYWGSSDLFGYWADANHAAQPQKAFAVTEYGAGASVKLHTEKPEPSFTPFLDPHYEEYQAIVHEEHWKQIQAREYLYASWAFVLFDFASDGRSEGDRVGLNNKGLISADHLVRKDAFYFYKANWSTTPTVYLTGRRFTERPDAVTDVKIYANTGPVTLMVNGAAVGTMTPDAFHTVVFPDVQLATGENSVQVVSTAGGVALQDNAVWTVAAS